MKHFVAGSGGRYVYSEDFVNLQDLALSMKSIFDGCDNFVISGCTVSGSNISSGYVWINGQVRYFSGASGVQYPYYIYESNSYTATEYKDEPNKTGRINYLCVGGVTLPAEDDPITNAAPSHIMITSSYTPKILDKFFGKYSLVLSSPSAKQTVSKEVEFSSLVTALQGVTANQPISVVNKSTGYAIKSMFKSDGAASVGLWLNNSLVTDVVFDKTGAVKVFVGSTEVASFTKSGVSLNKDFYAPKVKTASLDLTGGYISNVTDTTDAGAVIINHTGLNGGVTKFRDFIVYDGQKNKIMHIDGKNKSVSVHAGLSISHTGDGLKLIHKTKSTTDTSLLNHIVFQAMDGGLGSIGFSSTTDQSLLISNLVGDIKISPKTSVNIQGLLLIKGVSVSEIFVSADTYTKDMAKKVSVIDGKGLSQEDFTTALKSKLDGIKIANTTDNIDGLVNLSYVQQLIKNQADATKNLSDLKDKAAARDNLKVYSIDKITELLGDKLDSSKAYSGEIFTTALKTKLEGINEGRFQSTDDEGNVIPKENGYVTVNKMLYELTKYAPLTLDTYSEDQKKQAAANIGVYSKAEADGKFMVPSKLMDEYIAYLTNTGKTTEQALDAIRSKIGAASASSLSGYVTKTGNLQELEVKDDAAKKLICSKIGAAFAADYQSKLKDSGWQRLSVTGLYARQIGSIVCIQGGIKTTVGGNNLFFELPNQIDAPAHAVEFTHSQEGTYSNARKFIARIEAGSKRCMVIDNAVGGEYMAFTLTYMV